MSNDLAKRMFDAGIKELVRVRGERRWLGLGKPEFEASSQEVEASGVLHFEGNFKATILPHVWKRLQREARAPRKKPTELLEVTLKFHYCPSTSERWQEEIQEFMREAMYGHVEVPQPAMFKGELTSVDVNLRVKKFPSDTVAIQCCDGKWMYRDGSVRNH